MFVHIFSCTSRQSLNIVFYPCIFWIHDNNSCLTIKSDTGQHSQFLQMFSYLLMNNVRECKSINSSPCPTDFDVPHVTYDMWNVMWLTFDMWCVTCDVTEKAIMLSFQKVPTRGLSDPLVLWKGLHGIGWSAGVHQKPALPLQLQLQLTKVQPKCTLRLSSTFFICDRWRQKDN